MSIISDDTIDRLEAQARALASVKIYCTTATYERQLPAGWFYVLAKAGIDVSVVQDHPDHVGIGLLDLQEETIWWLDIWNDEGGPDETTP